MNSSRTYWLLGFLVFGIVAYAIAEDITLTTYYPSPRGVYQELRTQGDVGIGNIASAPTARLQVTQTTANRAVHITQTGAADALRVEDSASPDSSPFVITETGNVGIGTATPGGQFEISSADPIDTALRLTNTFSNDSAWEVRAGGPGNPFIIWGGLQGSEFERMRFTETGPIGIGTAAPAVSAQLDISSTTRGFLPPRVTTAQRNAIAGPVQGLTIYNTTDDELQSYTASGWAGGGTGYTGNAFSQSACSGLDMHTTVGNFVNGRLMALTSTITPNDPACAGPPPPVY